MSEAPVFLEFTKAEAERLARIIEVVGEGTEGEEGEILEALVSELRQGRIAK